MNTDGSLIEARDVTKSFGQTQALRGASVAINPGEILAIMGPSGSGKSTLLHCLAGIFPPDSGEVWFDGRRLDTLNEAERTRLRRTTFVFQPAIPARGYRDDFFLKVMAAARSGDPATLSAVLGRQRAHLLRQLHALAEARGTTSATAVESLLITAAELHIRADLGVVDAAETTLTADPAVVSEQSSSPGLAPPQSAAS
jgi:ABC-type branched-subunit amino acid transport system ATPase component